VENVVEMSWIFLIANVIEKTLFFFHAFFTTFFTEFFATFFTTFFTTHFCALYGSLRGSYICVLKGQAGGNRDPNLVVRARGLGLVGPGSCAGLVGPARGPRSA
jgi:hypothetical protein